MLYDAKETLPTTNLEWRVSDMTEKKKEYKKYPYYSSNAAMSETKIYKTEEDFVTVSQYSDKYGRKTADRYDRY